MGRLVCVTLSAAGAAILATFIFLRPTLWFHLEAGGDPVLDVRAGFRFPGIRRERRISVSRDAGKSLLRKAAGRMAGGGQAGDGRPQDAAAAGPPGSGATLARLRAALPEVLRAASLHSLDAVLAVGTGDAADTAVACGLANAVGGLGIALMSRAPGAPRRASFQAVPRWGSKAEVHLRVHCIARPRLSQAIFAAWRVYRVFHPAPFSNARPATRRTAAVHRTCGAAQQERRGSSRQEGL